MLLQSKILADNREVTVSRVFAAHAEDYHLWALLQNGTTFLFIRMRQIPKKHLVTLIGLNEEISLGRVTDTGYQGWLASH